VSSRKRQRTEQERAELNQSHQELRADQDADEAQHGVQREATPVAQRNAEAAGLRSVITAAQRARCMRLLESAHGLANDDPDMNFIAFLQHEGTSSMCCLGKWFQGHDATRKLSDLVYRLRQGSASRASTQPAQAKARNMSTRAAARHAACSAGAMTISVAALIAPALCYTYWGVVHAAGYADETLLPLPEVTALAQSVGAKWRDTQVCSASPQANLVLCWTIDHLRLTRAAHTLDCPHAELSVQHGAAGGREHARAATEQGAVPSTPATCRKA